MSLKVFLSVGTTEFDQLLKRLNAPEVIEVLRRQKVSEIYFQEGRLVNEGNLQSELAQAKLQSDPGEDIGGLHPGSAGG